MAANLPPLHLESTLIKPTPKIPSVNQSILLGHELSSAAECSVGQPQRGRAFFVPGMDTRRHFLILGEKANGLFCLVMFGGRLDFVYVQPSLTYM